MDKKALWEATKEPLRLLVLAIIPFGLAYTETISYEWATALTLVLKGTDKFLHEVGKNIESESLTKGLTRF